MTTNEKALSRVSPVQYIPRQSTWGLADCGNDLWKSSFELGMKQ